MQNNRVQDKNLKSFQNSFCYGEKAALTEFVNLKKVIKILTNEIPLNLSKEEILECCRYMVMKNAKFNVTDLTVFSSEPELALQSMLEVGMKGKVLVDAKKIIEKAFTKIELEKLRQNSLKIEIGIFINGILNFSEEELSILAEFAGREKLPVYINFLRTLDEAGVLDKTNGKSPARVLEDFGFLDRKCYCLGCNFLDKDDAEILASYDAEIVLTPTMDMLFGRGFINLQMLFGQGLKVSLGTGESFTTKMRAEAGVAMGNTANLMYDPFPIKYEQLDNMYEIDGNEILQVKDEDLQNQRQKVEEILRRIK